MLVLESSPSQSTPSPLGQPANWTIYNPTLRTVLPQPNTYVIRIGETIAAPGNTIRIAGVTFTTNNDTDYTDTTWRADQAVFRSAFNLANALRSNAQFRQYNVRTARPSDGQPWRVIAISTLSTNASASDADNDDFGTVTVEHIAGRAEQRLRQRLWYQFWANNGPVSTEKDAPFDQNGRTNIDGQAVARRLLGATPPDPEQTNPLLDPVGATFLSLKYGTYTTDGNCSPSFGEAHETPAVPFINAVLQYPQVNGMRPHGPLRQSSLLRWLTDRPNERKVSRSGYEWTDIYLGPSPYFAGATNCRLRKEFFTESNASLGEIIYPMDGAGLWRIPTGFLNAVPDGYESAAYYTITVQAPLGFGWFNTSDTLVLTPVDRGCVAAEVYYLGGRGSWETLSFEELNSRGLSQSSQSWQREIVADPGYTGAVLADNGGAYQRVTASADVFTLTTPRIAENDRQAMTEMLDSPVAYLLTEDENGRAVTRRITFARESYRTANREGRTVVSVSFTFAQPRRLR